jgi:hypothetical protein
LEAFMKANPDKTRSMKVLYMATQSLVASQK